MKVFKRVFLVLVALVSTLTLAACDTGNNINDYTDIKASDIFIKNEQTVVVFKGNGDLLEEKDEYSLYTYMNKLKDVDLITFDGYTDSYGYYVTSVNGVEEVKGTTSSYWLLYISYTTLDGDSTIYSDASYGTYEVDGKTLNSASYGVSGIPYVIDATYALVYTTF
jgi:hypothetical protein